MTLIFHIIIALTSVIFTAYMSFSPSRNKLRISYTLVAATLATGTYLTILKPSHMVSSCVAGLLYIGVVLAAIWFARRKLALRSNTPVK